MFGLVAYPLGHLSLAVGLPYAAAPHASIDAQRRLYFELGLRLRSLIDTDFFSATAAEAHDVQDQDLLDCRRVGFLAPLQRLLSHTCGWGAGSNCETHVESFDHGTTEGEVSAWLLGTFDIIVNTI